DEVRLRSDDAVLLLWQTDYHTPLIPTAPVRASHWAEKLVERLGMLPVDVPDPRRRVAAATGLLGSLDALGIRVGTPRSARVEGRVPGQQPFPPRLAHTGVLARTVGSYASPPARAPDRLDRPPAGPLGGPVGERRHRVGRWRLLDERLDHQAAGP